MLAHKAEDEAIICCEVDIVVTGIVFIVITITTVFIFIAAINTKQTSSPMLPP